MQGQGGPLMQLAGLALAQCWASCHSVAGVHNTMPSGHTTEWDVLAVVSAASWQHCCFCTNLVVPACIIAQSNMLPAFFDAEN